MSFHGETCLYRHFDAADQLLYVGISLSAIERLNQHKKSDWFGEIATVKVERFQTREEALEAERKAIRDEAPAHNVAGVKPGRKPTEAESARVTIRLTKAALAFVEKTEGPEAVRELLARQA